MREKSGAVEAARPWRAAIAWMALVLGPGFFLVYGLCNELTALRADVGSFFFAWERPASYTHLDVYKRQATLRYNKDLSAFYGWHGF